MTTQFNGRVFRESGNQIFKDHPEGILRHEPPFNHGVVARRYARRLRRENRAI